MKKILLIILILSTQVSADTVVDSVYYNNKVVNWNKAGSPYIINNPLTFSSSTLNISDAKVIIKSGSINLYNNSFINMSNVLIENEGGRYALSSFNSKVFAEAITVNSARFIESYGGDVSIDALNSTNQDDKGLFSIYSKSNFTLTNSHIENYRGKVLNFYDAGAILIKANEFVNNNLVLDLYTASPTQVNTNDFERNNVSIESYITGDFEDNYFEKEKPTIYEYKEDAPVGDNNILAGPFTVQRFAKEKQVKKPEKCCSSVLFLPGVMGSRLYMDGLTENQLWEPNKNADVKKLYLDEFGKSINNIFTKEIIGKTNILGGLPYVDKDIYKDFVLYLDKQKNKNIIQSYNAVPYDWRMSADHILQDGVRLKDKNIDLVQSVKELQRTSKTGKVTIITHSNGGLVAKQLLLELQRLGLESLIDKVVFVAMPEYGTAQAITALVFGHNQSLAGGLIMRSSIARELAKNMATAYTLLPSEKYYAYNPDADRVLQETVIRNYSRLNPGLLERSKEMHGQLDAITYPKDLKVYQIVGTGIDTLSDIKIDDKNLYKIIPLYDKDGDGVVQDMSYSRTGTVLYVDLNNTSYKHANIMNSEKVLGYIDSIVNPRAPSFPDIGLDYNKIIKNNSYKLLRITQSNPNNKISQYLNPLEMDLSIGMSRIKDNTDNELFFDRYSADTTNDFRQALEHLNSNRFEEFDNGINYLYTTDMDTFSINSKNDNVINISILESIDGEISTVEYKGIPVFKNSEIRFDPGNDSNTLNMTLPVTGQAVELAASGHNAEMDLNQKIDIVMAEVRSSKMEWYLKERYLRRIEIYRQNKDPKYLETVKKRILDAITSIGSLAYSPTLRLRYAKIKEDYIYLNSILLKL